MCSGGVALDESYTPRVPVSDGITMFGGGHGSSARWWCKPEAVKGNWGNGMTVRVKEKRPSLNKSLARHLPSLKVTHNAFSTPTLIRSSLVYISEGNQVSIPGRQDLASASYYTDKSTRECALAKTRSDKLRATERAKAISLGQNRKEERASMEFSKLLNI